MVASKSVDSPAPGGVWVAVTGAWVRVADPIMGSGRRTWALLEPVSRVSGVSGSPRLCWDSDMGFFENGHRGHVGHCGTRTRANTGPDMGTEVPMSGGDHYALRPSGPLTGRAPS